MTVQNAAATYLPSIPTLILTCAKTEHRIPLLVANLRQHGHTRIAVIKGPPAKPYWHGLTRALKEAAKSPAPYLVLEDDAQPHPTGYAPIINHPAYADVLNLGPALIGWEANPLPGWTVHPRVNRYLPLQYQPVNEAWIRSGNMLGGHALLFLTQHGIDAYRNSYTNSEPSDVCVARILPNTQTLAPRTPFFYQTDGRHDAITLAGVASLFTTADDREHWQNLRDEHLRELGMHETKKAWTTSAPD